MGAKLLNLTTIIIFNNIANNFIIIHLSSVISHPSKSSLPLLLRLSRPCLNIIIIIMNNFTIFNLTSLL